MNLLRNLEIKRNKKSPEVSDNSFKDIEQGLSRLWTDTEVSHLNQEIMKAQVEDLLKKYESLKSWIKWTEWNGSTKIQLQKELNQNIKKLRNIQRDLNKGHTYQNLTKYQNDILQLIAYYESYEQARQNIVVGWKTSNIPVVIDSKQDAKRAKRNKESDAKYQQDMNEILHSTTITSLWNNDMERYEEYLKLVVNWHIEPSSHPFYKAHEQSFNQLKNTNPSLYQTLVPSWAWRTQYRVVMWVPESWTISWSTIRTASQSESFPSRLGKWFGDVLWNIFPSIENNPRQKQAREQAGAVVALWWAIFMWFKMLKNVFTSKEKNPNKRRDAALRGWWLLALTNWDKIIKWGKNWVQDAFNWHPAEKIKATNELFKTYWFSDTEALNIAEKYIWAPVATISALHFIPIYELSTQNIIEHNNDRFSFNYDNYKKYINWFDRDNDQKKIVLAAWEKLRDNNSINAWLATFSINSPSDLDRIAWWNKNKTLADSTEVQNWRKECVDRVKSWVNKELFNQWLRATDEESATKIVREYNEHWWENIKKSELKQLIILRMKEWLLQINGEVEYDLEDMLNDPNVDLENKTMKWFTNNWWWKIEFDSYKELFDIVWLTKKIKQNFAWRPTAKAVKGNILDTIRTWDWNDDKPFHIAIWWRIEFNDHNFWEIWKNGTFRGDTDVVKALTLRKISDTLKGNKQFYSDYLNKRRINDGQYWRM